MNEMRLMKKLRLEMLDGQENFLAMLSRRDNPHLPLAIEEFDETAFILFGNDGFSHGDERI